MKQKLLLTLTLVITTGMVLAYLASGVEHLLAGIGLKYLLIILIGSALCLVNAVTLYGRSLALLFFVPALVLGWSVEKLGIETGIPFGYYYYTDRLGPGLGGVPLVMPLAWFMVVYLGHILANLVVGQAPRSQVWSMRRGVRLAIIGAFITTAYDVAFDPGMSSMSLLPCWVWLGGGYYFGVPISNYLGWLVTSFAFLLLFYWLQQRHRQMTARSLPSPSLASASFAVLSYAVLGLGHLLNGEPAGTRPITLLVMGLPVLGATIGLRAWSRQHPEKVPVLRLDAVLGFRGRQLRPASRYGGRNANRSSSYQDRRHPESSQRRH